MPATTSSTIPVFRKRPAAAFSLSLLALLLASLCTTIKAYADPDVSEMRAIGKTIKASTASHAFLQDVCDRFGGRLAGTPRAHAAIEYIANELRSAGLDARIETFPMPVWHRGDDRVEMRAPFQRILRVAAISYTQPHDPFEAKVVHLKKGTLEDFKIAVNASGCIGLIDQGTSESTRDIIARAAKLGLRGLLLTDRVNGGQLLARTGSFLGTPLPIPVYSITQEEGMWLSRLCTLGENVRIMMHTRSHCMPSGTGKNIVVRLKGASAETVVVGAHVDSWDLGQGAIDNGIGVAQLHALALALKDKPLRRTIEFVWLDGEELGIWGSRYHAEHTKGNPVVAMVNLDMVGVPIGVNALGDDDIVPLLEKWNRALAEKPLPDGVYNVNWLGSDHTPFQIAGIRAITFHAPIPHESVRYYHDLADTIDKVSPALISDSSAIIGQLVYWLAQEETLSTTRRTEQGTAKLFASHINDNRLKALGWEPALPSDAPKKSSDSNSTKQ